MRNYPIPDKPQSEWTEDEAKLVAEYQNRKNPMRNANVTEPLRTIVNSMSTDLPYAISFDHEKHWMKVSENHVRAQLAPFYKDVDEVMRQIDEGEKITYRSLVIRRNDMQKD